MQIESKSLFVYLFVWVRFGSLTLARSLARLCRACSFSSLLMASVAILYRINSINYNNNIFHCCCLAVLSQTRRAECVRVRLCACIIIIREWIENELRWDECVRNNAKLSKQTNMTYTETASFDLILPHFFCSTHFACESMRIHTFMSKPCQVESIQTNDKIVLTHIDHKCLKFEMFFVCCGCCHHQRWYNDHTPSCT